MKILLQSGEFTHLPFGHPIRGLRIESYTMTPKDTGRLLSMHEDDIIDYFLLLHVCQKPIKVENDK